MWPVVSGTALAPFARVLTCVAVFGGVVQLSCHRITVARPPRGGTPVSESSHAGARDALLDDPAVERPAHEVADRITERLRRACR